MGWKESKEGRGDATGGRGRGVTRACGLKFELYPGRGSSKLRCVPWWGTKG